MSPFNDSVERPSIKKKPSATGANTTNNLVKLTSLGLLGFGVILLNSLTGGTRPTGHTNKDIVSVFSGYELTAGCTNSGCIKVLAGATKDGTIFASGSSIRIVGNGDVKNTPLCELSATGAVQGSNCVITAGVSILGTVAGTLSVSDADNRYVNTAGDAMTGALAVNATVSASGARITRNLTVSGSIISESLARIPRIVAFPLCDGATACATGTGVSFRIPRMMNNFILSGATLDVSGVGVTGTMTVRAERIRAGDVLDFFSTNITLDTIEASSDTAATPAAINASNRTVLDGDIITPRVTGVHTTPAKGATLNLLFVPQ